LGLQLRDAIRRGYSSGGRLSVGERSLAAKLTYPFVHRFKAMDRRPAQARLTRNRRHRYANRNTSVLWVVTVPRP